MKISYTLLLFAVGLTIQSNGQGNPNPDGSVDVLIQSEMSTERFPGVSTIIVKNGEVVWVESYGFADVENAIAVEDTTVFLLASMSKVFTGTASMQLYEAGTTDLDQDVSNYLTWPVGIPGFQNDSITIRQLMTHTSSIEDNGLAMDGYYDYPDPTISLQECMQRYFSMSGADYDPAANFYNSAPGSVYNYSNMGTALNGYITEAVSGMPFDDFCDANIFNPLCMEKTAWHFADFDSAHVARPYQYVGGNYVPYAHYGFADYPDGQLRSNVHDLGNFMIAYLNGGTLGTNTLLNSSSISEMWSAQVPTLDPTQGLNWYQEELFYSGGSEMLWGHNGGENGVSTDMYLDPINNIGICVLTNGEGDALYICDELYDYARSLNPTSSILPDCGELGIGELNHGDKKVIRIIDLIGRETTDKQNAVLIYIYSDGSTEKVFKVE
jgi:CubicO group peptidase (beta-lactamase class C family)